MNAASTHSLTITYDGMQWQAVDADYNMMTLSTTDDSFLPLLPDGAIVSRLLLPVEQLLTRTFSLPFSNTKFIDQDILAQELEEHTSETSESWWLSWQAGHIDNGVAGMMIGLPESLRQLIDSSEGWQQATSVHSDIWARLNHQLDNYPEIKQAAGTTAIFDTDSTGIFFGVWHHIDESSKQGFWQGMRRLNWQENEPLHDPSSSLLEDIKRSLTSMGWQHDEHAAVGRVHPQLHSALQVSLWHGELYDVNELPSRRDATIAAASTPNLNFRHGQWRSGSKMGQLKVWHRSLTLAAALLVVWSAAMMWQNHQLEQQVVMHQQRTIDAFHKGLPNEKVMIDALAQLRKAVGGNSNASGQNKQHLTEQWLRHIEMINRVYRQTPWTIKEISFQNGIMSMSGQAKDLQTMNLIHQALQRESGVDVKLRDTDLSNNQVRFKLVWS